MRKTRVRFLLVFLCMVLLVLPTYAQGARLRVGVFEFSGAGLRHERQTAANLLVKTLVDLGRFDVIERERLDQIMREQRFQQSYPVDQSTAIEMGRIVGVSVAFIGSIDHLDARWERVESGKGVYHATAGVTIKVIDVRSGRLIKVLAAKGLGTKDRRDEAQIAALESCFDLSFVEQLRKLFALESQVSRVEGDMVYLPLGRELGVRKGQRFMLLRPEYESGWDLDVEVEFSREVGMIQIIDVTGSMARGLVVWSSAPPAPGDFLVEVGDPRNWVLGLTLQSTELRLSPYRQDAVTVWDWRIGRELPFRHETGMELFVASALDEVSLGGVGGYGSVELPLIPGAVYATVGGAVGIAMVTQPYWGYPGSYWTIPSSGKATGWTAYVRGDTGLKLYLTRQQGLRLELGASWYAAPSISAWGVRRDKKPRVDVSDYVGYPEVQFGGLSLSVGASVAF